MKSHLSTGRHPGAAFSLVETVLALGIMSLAITALLGLLPHGLEMSKKAADAAAEARIVDNIVGQLSTMTATQLKGISGHIYHFDDQGVDVDGTKDSSLSTYLSRTVIPSLANGVTLPGATTGESTMQRVAIQIVQTPLLNFNFDTAPPKSFTTVPVILAPSM